MQLRSIYKLITVKMSDMNENSKAIVIFLLDNINNPDVLTLKIISRKTKQSNATIVRFAQDLGFSGFIEMRNVFIDANINLFTKNYEIVFNKNFKNNTQAFYQAYFEVLTKQQNSIEKLIKDNILHQAASLINDANKIVIVASNINFNQSIDFKNKLIALGMNCFLEQDTHMHMSFINTCSNDDLFITISLSNTNEEVIRVGKLAKAKGAKWIHIGTKNKELKDDAIDLLISFESLESEIWNLYSLRGEGLFQILNLIFVTLLNNFTNIN